MHVCVCERERGMCVCVCFVCAGVHVPNHLAEHLRSGCAQWAPGVHMLQAMYARC